MGTNFVTGWAKEKDSYEAGRKAAQLALEKLGQQRIDVSIVFASSVYDYTAVINGVREVTQNAPLVGCSSAGEFTEEKIDKESVVCALVSSDTHKFFPGLGKGLKEDEIKTMQQAAEHFPQSVEGYPYLSAIVLVDGLAGKGEEAALAALAVLGPSVKFSGGAAADDLKFKETKIFYNEQALTDAVSLCLMASKTPVAIGVRHGHEPVTPPMMVTKAKNNVLYEVDGKPAFEVWKESLRAKAKELGIDVDNLNDASAIGSFLIRYEAGLLTGQDYKVRVPLSANADGSINFACTMLEGSMIRLMQSPKEAQIASAKKAAEIALKGARGVTLAGAIIFDCVCRGIILGNDFHKGVEAVKSTIGNIPVIGFETYGEIAMEMGQMSGFHNTTTVVLLIPA